MSRTGAREASLPHLKTILMCNGRKGAFIGLTNAMLFSRRGTWDPCDSDYTPLLCIPMPSMKETFRKRVGNYYLGRTLGEVQLPAPCLAVMLLGEHMHARHPSAVLHYMHKCVRALSASTLLLMQ